MIDHRLSRVFDLKLSFDRACPGHDRRRKSLPHPLNGIRRINEVRMQGWRMVRINALDK